MATEIAVLPFKPDSNLDDPNSPMGKTLRECFEIIRSRKNMQRLYWGMTVEQPNAMRLFIDWDSVEDHNNFRNSDVYKSFLEKFGSMLDGKGHIIHAHFKPHPPNKALSESHTDVTEIVSLYFPSSYSEEDQKTVHENLGKLCDAVTKYADGAKGGQSGGWVIEEQKNPDSGEPNKVYVLLIGWKSVQAHMDFRETDEFKQNIHWLRGAKDLKTVKVVHVPMKQLDAIT